MDHFFSFQKKFWNPYFYSVSCDKIENGRPFSPLRCGFFKASNFEKTLVPEGSGYFHPKTPIMSKPENILTPPGWPYPYDFRDGSPEKAAQKPTHTQTSRQDIK